MVLTLARFTTGLRHEGAQGHKYPYPTVPPIIDHSFATPPLLYFSTSLACRTGSTSPTPISLPPGSHLGPPPSGPGLARHPGCRSCAHLHLQSPYLQNRGGHPEIGSVSFVLSLSAPVMACQMPSIGYEGKNGCCSQRSNPLETDSWAVAWVVWVANPCHSRYGSMDQHKLQAFPSAAVPYANAPPLTSPASGPHGQPDRRGKSGTTRCLHETSHCGYSGPVTHFLNSFRHWVIKCGFQ